MDILFGRTYDTCAWNNAEHKIQSGRITDNIKLFKAKMDKLAFDFMM